MKTAVEEIREALNRMREASDGVGDWRVAISAIARLDELEAIVGKHARGECADAAVSAYKQGREDGLVKQALAEAEERGRDEAFGVLHALREALPTISGGIRHHAFKAREAFREVERALCHYDTRAAERAKGGG